MSRSVWCVIASMSVACAAPARFLPASDVERSSRDPSAGVVTRGGVTLVADADRWSGHPATLRQLVTPIHVRILNQSDRDLAVRYQTFVLTSDTGRELRPMPPIALDRSGPVRARRAPAPDASAFHYAPYYRDVFGEEVDYWTGGFAFDPYFYDGYAAWSPSLPTEAMIERALPEGVIGTGGWVSGFVYFERLDPEAKRVTLHVDLDLPQGEERVATIDIAFVDHS